MADSEISKLEQRIDELIVLTETLGNENSLMRERQDILVEELFLIILHLNQKILVLKVI